MIGIVKEESFDTRKITPEEQLKSTIMNLVNGCSYLSGETFNSHMNNDQKNIKYWGSLFMSSFYNLFQLVKAQKPSNDWKIFERFITRAAVLKKINAVEIMNIFDSFLYEMYGLGMLGDESITVFQRSRRSNNEKDASDESG